MRISSVVLVVAAASLTACSGTAVGTGGPSGTSSNTSGGPSVTGGGTDTSGGATVADSGTKVSPYDTLFGAPASTALTPDSLTGLWAGTMSNTSDDVRIQIGTDSVVVAVRCGSGFGLSTQTIGTEIATVLSASSMRVVESKTVGDSNCKIIVHPQTIPLCTGSSYGCFDLTGTTLHFNSVNLFEGDGISSSGPSPSFTKISD